MTAGDEGRQIGDRHAGVAGGGREAAMAEQRLDVADVWRRAGWRLTFS